MNYVKLEYPIKLLYFILKKSIIHKCINLFSIFVMYDKVL